MSLSTPRWILHYVWKCCLHGSCSRITVLCPETVVEKILMPLIYRCVKLDFACAWWLQWGQRNRTKVPGDQSSWLPSRAKNRDCARAHVWWWYGGFPNSLKKERTSPHAEGQYFCLETTSSVSQFCFPDELKRCLAAGMWDAVRVVLHWEGWVGLGALGHGSSDFRVLRTLFLVI